MTDQEQELFDIAYGLHSRIPACCIRFFVGEWRTMWRDREGTPYSRALDASSARYVQCPECLGRGNVVQLLICNHECGGEHRQDFVPKEATNGYRSDTHKQLHPSDRV